MLDQSLMCSRLHSSLVGQINHRGRCCTGAAKMNKPGANKAEICPSCLCLLWYCLICLIWRCHCLMCAGPMVDGKSTTFLSNQKVTFC